MGGAPVERVIKRELSIQDVSGIDRVIRGGGIREGWFAVSEQFDGRSKSDNLTKPLSCIGASSFGGDLIIESCCFDDWTGCGGEDEVRVPPLGICSSAGGVAASAKLGLESRAVLGVVTDNAREAELDVY